MTQRRLRRAPCYLCARERASLDTWCGASWMGAKQGQLQAPGSGSDERPYSARVEALLHVGPLVTMAVWPSLPTVPCVPGVLKFVWGHARERDDRARERMTGAIAQCVVRLSAPRVWSKVVSTMADGGHGTDQQTQHLICR